MAEPTMAPTGLDPGMPTNGFVSLDEVFPPPTPPPMPAPLPQGNAQHPSVLHLSDDESTRLLNQLRMHYDEATSGREQNQERRAFRYRRYLADVSLRNGLQPWDDAPQLFLPLTRQTVETLCGRFAKALVGTPDTIELKGIGEEDVQLAWRRQAFYRWQLAQLNDFATVLDEALMDAALDSLGIIKVYRYAQPYTPPPGLEMLQTIVKYETIDLGTMLIPPDARGLQYPEARYLGQQLWIVPNDEFPGMRQRGFAVPEPRVENDWGQGTYQPDRREEIELFRESIHPDAWYEDRVEMVEMYEVLTRDDGSRSFVVCHWFPSLLAGDGDEPSPHIARVVLLEDALPQTVFPRPMWPYFPIVLWPQPRQLRGLNVPDRLETYQDALNRLAEQMLHLGDITILPLVFANLALTGDLPDLTKIRPGQIVPLDNLGPNGLQIHQPNSANRHFAEQMNIVRSWAEEDSNVTAFTQGRSATQPNAPRTLGGLSLLLQQGNEAYNQQVVKLARQLSEALKFGYALWQNQSIDGLTFPAPQESQIEQRLYEGGQQPPTQNAQLRQVEMQPGDLSGLFDVTVQVNPDSHLEEQKLLSAGERLDAVLAPIWPEGRRLLWREIWTRLGLQSFDRFYPEFVAKNQTMLLALQVQAQLAQMEMQLMQMGNPQGIQEAQAATQASHQEGGPVEMPPPTAPQGQPLQPPGGPGNLQAVIQALAQHAGVAGGPEPLPAAGVNRTPHSVLNGFEDSGF